MNNFREHEVRFVPEFGFLSKSAEDYPEGYIAGWASTPDIDWYESIIIDGAFSESIAKRGISGPKGIKLLSFHDMDKPSGVIKKLECRDKGLWIEAQLALQISYVKDLYEAAKINNGLNFSVGFNVIDGKFVKYDANDVYVINKADLIEVSIVSFPANPECEMLVVKEGGAKTVSEFERMLVAKGIADTRRSAHRIVQEIKKNSHLFGEISQVLDDSELSDNSNDVSQRSYSDEISKFRDKISEIRKSIAR